MTLRTIFLATLLALGAPALASADVIPPDSGSGTDAGGSSGTDAGSGSSSGGGCAAAPAGGSALALVGLLGAAGLLRRRRA